MASAIDILDHPHLDSPPFSIQVHIPVQGSSLGCIITSDTYHCLPYICDFTPGTELASSLLQHGRPSSSFWILSVNNQEFISAKACVSYLRSLQQPSSSSYVLCIFARRQASQRTTYEGNRVLFNQIRLCLNKEQPTPAPTASIIIPAGCKVISSPTRPPTPAHFGQTLHLPFAADWKEALFGNYNKMLASGTFGAPILRTAMPPGKSLLRSRVACRVKDTSLPNQYDLYARCCADGSTMKEYIDFTDSYSPVAGIDSIRILLNLSAASGLTVRVLDISNAFQNAIIFDATERVHISLPPFYLEWFRAIWPDYILPSDNAKDLVIPCLKSLQGMKNAGHRWYCLLSGRFRELKMVRSSSDHGVFIWDVNGERCYLALATDDVIVCSKSREPFQLLKIELERLFDLTSSEGRIIKFLNLRIVQSPSGISFDQTNHIRNIILAEYFKDIPSTGIKFQPFPFPLSPAFERQLYESPPLVGIDLTTAVKRFRFSFGHIVGGLMHINGVSRPDLAYCCMRYSGYMACPNIVIFEALHLTMCYLFHHPHLPIMYSSKPMSGSGDSLQTFWSKGDAEYLTPDFGDGLATFTDADHARDLRTRRSVSSYFTFFNHVLVSWGCKKQPTTALHSTGSEVTSLHRGGQKSKIIYKFLESIGTPLSGPCILFEDNQGTIKLVRTNRLTDTVRHHDVKLAWLTENFLAGTFRVCYTKTGLMVVDCITKPVNGSQLYQQISFSIGQRFYPDPSMQHYHDLELDKYSWRSRYLKLPSSP